MNIYNITLKSGVQRTLTREESDGKSIIGLWNWSLKQRNDIVLDFNECVVVSSEIALIDRPINAEELQIANEIKA